MTNSINNSVKNVLIFEAYTYANIGSGALIENSIKLVRNIIGNSNIVISAHHKKSVQEISGINTIDELFKLPYKQLRRIQFVWLIKNAVWMFVHMVVRLLRLPIPERFYTFSTDRLATIYAYKKSDICISIGAERINDNFILGLPFSLYNLWLVKNYKKKLILFPQTIGPFHFKLSKFISKNILNLCDYVYLRDIRSIDTMRELGIPESKYAFVPDIATLQEAVAADNVKLIFHREKIPSGVKLAGISAMEWTYFKARQGSRNFEDYKKHVAAGADYLIEKYGYHVVFVPTNLSMHGCREDDVKTARAIYELIRNKQNISLIGNLYTPAELKGFLGTLDMLIATRMHACILGTGAFIPTLSINYQFKLYEYMKLLGLENNTVNIEELTYEKLQALIDFTYQNRESIRRQLEIKITELQSLVRNNIGRGFEVALK